LGIERHSEADEFILQAGTRVGKRAALRELWAFRGTVLAFAERSVRVQYKQAVFGIAWAVIQPLVLMGVFTLTLGHLAQIPGGGVTYAAFSLSALVPWSYLSSGVSSGGSSLVSAGATLRRVYFPREVPVLSAIVSSALDFSIGLVLFFAIGPFLGAHVSWYWLLTPFLFVLLAVLTVSVALPIAALTVYYRDFRFALPFGIQLWLFASPVAYPLSQVPEQWRTLYATLNPAAGILDAFSNVLARGAPPDVALLGLSVLGTAVVGSLGYVLFKRLEPNFADVI
jgi:lipopolysaccharide transport system permease protein